MHRLALYLERLESIKLHSFLNNAHYALKISLKKVLRVSLVDPLLKNEINEVDEEDMKEILTLLVDNLPTW